ncbi:MAG: FkbM family methyltransferase, partial [Chloroflexota bacterium]|nr:FkbM family methyltransferase [Chloroflexota bacterium]
SIVRIFLNRGSTLPRAVQLRHPPLAFKIRGAMDVWSIKETFLDRFYERYGFRIQPGWTVVDIGAGIGEYTLFAAIHQPGVRVFAFEPYPPSFSLMEENLHRNGITNVRAFNEAVAETSGELILDLTGGEPLQFQSHSKPDAAVEKSLSVRSRSLADAFATLEIESCDLLKMDCEGAEYSILFGTPPSIFELVRHIVMEYHDHTSHYQHHDLVRFLDAQGYQVEIFPNPVHSDIGYLRAIREH